MTDRLLTSEQKVRLVEEVPGVPDNERWFVSGGSFKPDFSTYKDHYYPHFSTQAEGEKFLADQGIREYIVEHFEP